MNRAILFLLLCFWFSFTCSEQGHETSLNCLDQNSSAPLKRIKCVRSTYSRHNYYYDSMGRLERTVITDGRDSTTAKLTEIYEYNAKGKIIRAHSELCIQNYFYDSESRLLKHTRTDNVGRTDSVMFVYNADGTAVGKWKNIQYCYENKRLIRIHKGDQRSAAGGTIAITVDYTYTAKRDLAYAYVLNFMDPMSQADFSGGNEWVYGPCELSVYGQSGDDFSFIPLRMERSYDSSGYPVKLRILTVTGVVIEPGVVYTYW